MNPQERPTLDTLAVANQAADTVIVAPISRPDSVKLILRKPPVVIKEINDTVHLPDTLSRFNTNIITGREVIRLTAPGFEPLKQSPYTAITSAEGLRKGIPVPELAYRNDWTIILLFSTVIMLLLVRLFGRGRIGSVFLSAIPRPFSSADRSEKQHLFHWSETIFNLLAFINISLFLFFLSVSYGFSPPGGSPVVSWLIIFLVIAVGITLRHLTSIITGAGTGTGELFAEYQLRIYQGYRLAGILLFFVVVGLCYTNFNPAFYLTTGIIIISVIYIIRVISLLLIFTSQHISISYLILYLCALEILPAAILIRLLV